MAKRYSVVHAFYHPTGEKDVDGHDIKKYYTRENEQDVAELPAAVLKDKIARGLVVESEDDAPKPAEDTGRVSGPGGPAASQAAAEPEAAEPRARRGKAK